MENINEKKINTGLQPTPIDERDFQLGAFFNLPKVGELPTEFFLKPLKIKDQGFTDFCSAFATTSVSEIQEGVELNPIFSFGASKEITEDPESWGQNLRDACKAHVQYGALEEAEAQFKTENIDKYRSTHRNLSKWGPEARELAKKHCKESFWKITGQYDHFDNIRSAMWKFKEEKRAVIFGVEFGWLMEDHVLAMENYKEQGASGHAMAIVGWESKDYVITLQSYGLEAGNNGLQLMHRDAVNKLTEKYGAYMLIDMPKEDAKYYLDNDIKEGDWWFVELVKVIKKFFADIKGVMDKKK